MKALVRLGPGREWTLHTLTPASPPVGTASLPASSPGPHGRRGQARSPSPQDVLMAEMETWQPLWMAREEGEELQPLPLGPVVERLQVTEMMSVLKTCNWCTGLGLDQLHTRHLALCSDRCFHLLGSCFFVAEEEGLRASAKDSIDCFPLTVPSGSAHFCTLAQAAVNRWHSARRQSSRAVVHALLRGVPSFCLRTVVPGGRFCTRLSTFSRSFLFFFLLHVHASCFLQCVERAQSVSIVRHVHRN